MAAQTTTQAVGGRGKRRSVALVGLALGVALAGVVAMGGMTRQADAVLALLLATLVAGIVSDAPVGVKNLTNVRNMDGGDFFTLATAE
jgi:hypothetical protein